MEAHMTTDPVAILRHESDTLKVIGLLTEGVADALLATVTISSPSRTLYESIALVDDGATDLAEAFHEACRFADGIEAEIKDAELRALESVEAFVNRSEGRVGSAPDSRSE
jgi:hypothetical protein